ncbi:MAG: HNH endonuclease [Myxococcota bacterium]
MRRRSLPPAQRARIFERDERRCTKCGTTKGNLEIHHVKEVVYGGTDDDSNLVLICKECHAKETALLAKARRIQRKMRPDVEGPQHMPHAGPAPKKKKIPSRGFPDGFKRTIPSRPLRKKE